MMAKMALSDDSDAPSHINSVVIRWVRNRGVLRCVAVMHFHRGLY